MKHLVMMLALAAYGANAAEINPVVASQSAYIQLISKIDGTQPDIKVPGISDLGKSIWTLADEGSTDLSSAWIDEGLSEENVLRSMSCIDSPQDFAIEDRGPTWFYRDTRELVCSAGGKGFSLVVEIGISQAQDTTWEYTTLQSINSIK